MADIIISSGITSDSITLNNEKLTVLDGGTANNIKIYEKGKMLISSGGNADILFVDSGGMLTVFNGGTASRIKLDGTEKRSGLMEIESGGSADVVTVGAYSELIVSSGGTATTIVWTPGVGHISACDGATALFFSKYSGVYYGNGHELLDSRWEMTRRTISEDQEMYVTSNGAAQYTTVNKDGRLDVFNGGSVTSTTVNAGTVYISSGGIAVDTTLNSGFLRVSSGGIADTVALRNNGVVQIYNGGKVTGAVASCADVEVFSGGEMNGLTLQGNAGLYVAMGGKLTGRMTVSDEANIFLEDNATVGFDISALTPGAPVRINNLSVFHGTEAADFTLTVSDTQKNGWYTLAIDATDFDRTISVLNTVGEQLGTLSVGMTTDIGGTEYFLALESGGTLSVRRGKEGDSPDLRPNGADDGWNNWLYDKKAKTPNTAVTDAEPVFLNAGMKDICPDGDDVIGYEENETVYGNFVGSGDDTDYRKIRLEKGASLSLSMIATDKTKFVICSLTSKTDKKGKTTYTQKALQTTTLQQGRETGIYYTAQTKPILLEAGEYYVAMQSTNAKKGGTAYYNVEVDQDASVFFDKGDNSDDWWGDVKEGPSGAVGDAGTLTAETEAVVENGWVGFGDAVDYMRFSLESGANLSFSVGASDAAKFTVWKLNSKTDKKGAITYSLKSIQATTLKKAKDATVFSAETKLLLLEAGDYYISVQSTNAKKGGSADYDVKLNTNCVFFSAGDDGRNDYVYDKKRNPALNESIDDFVTTELASDTAEIRLDKNAPSEDWNNFVGFGDAADYAKIRLSADATLSFTLKATDATKFTVWRLVEKTDKKGNISYSMKSLQATALKKAKGDELFAATTKALSLSEGEYFISMQSTNAAKGGSAFYRVELNQALCSGLPDAGIAASAAGPDAASGIAGLDGRPASQNAGLLA